MKLNQKIMTLVVSVFSILVLSTMAYHIARSRESRLFFEAYRENSFISIKSILNAREKAMNRSLEDNAAWDMMVNFIKNPDSVWAADNLVTARQTLGIDFLGIYDNHFRQVYQVHDSLITSYSHGLFAGTVLKTVFLKGPVCHYFKMTDQGIMEIYGSAIVPSTDIQRKTTAQGYLIFGMLWDPALISDLENSSNSNLEIHSLKSALKHDPEYHGNSAIVIPVILPDETGKGVVRIDFISKVSLTDTKRFFYLFTLIPFIITLLVVILFYLFIRRWITIPIQTIKESLDKQNPEKLSRIAYRQREFHTIAGLVRESFLQQQLLENEVRERKKAEDRISRYLEELKETNLSKDKFLSILAHDLKSPFHYLLGYSELLHNEYKNLSEDEKMKFIRIIHTSSKGLYNLLENLLQWSRLQTGRISYEPEIFDFSKEISLIADTINLSAEQKEISLSTEITSGVFLSGDRNMIRSAIHNILTNAIKYTPEKGLISVRTSLKNNKVELEVRDTGIGMNPEEIGKLFRIDISFSKPGTNKEPGTGLGLILCKEFVEKNGGSIFVESSPGQGSTFILSFPALK